MPLASERSSGLWAKIDRAKHHISEFETRLRKFQASRPYSLDCREDKETGDMVVYLEIREHPPTELSLIAGDAIHQLRSVLDHLACRLVEANSGGPIAKTAFPVFETAAKYRAMKPQSISGISQEAVKLIESVQPYQRGYEALWSLYTLDNYDKHRVVLVAAMGLIRTGISYRSPWASHPAVQQLLKDMIDNKPEPPPRTDTRSRVPLINSGELYRMNDGFPIQAGEQYSLEFELAFAEPESVNGLSILPLLHQHTKVVTQIVELLAPHL